MNNQRTLVIVALVAAVGLAVTLVVINRSDPQGAATGVASLKRRLIPSLAVYPPPNAIDVPNLWDGNEVPQPEPPPNGYPSGPVITVQALEGDLVIDKAMLTVASSGNEIPTKLLTRVNDKGMPYDTVALIPHVPLKPLTTFNVNFIGARDGFGFDETWSFTTRAAGCDPTAQDCGHGQGCYVVQGVPQCLWEGAGQLDAPCRFHNACGAGLTCFGSRCRPYCDASESSDPELACDAHCPHGTASVGEGEEVAHLGICFGTPCVEEGSTCGDNEGCYLTTSWMCNWAGEAGKGETCAAANDCRAGLSCFGTPDGTFTCHTLCNGAGLPDCEGFCEGAFRKVAADQTVKYCQ